MRVVCHPAPAPQIKVNQSPLNLLKLTVKKRRKKAKQKKKKKLKKGESPKDQSKLKQDSERIPEVSTVTHEETVVSENLPGGAASVANQAPVTTGPAAPPIAAPIVVAKDIPVAIASSVQPVFDTPGGSTPSNLSDGTTLTPE